jgi:protease I
MANELQGRKVAVLATDGYEQVELTEPVRALKEAGAAVTIVSIKAGQIQGYNHDEKADKVSVDQTLDEARAEGFDALLLPGGVQNPDTLRMTEKAVAFTRHFVQTGKPIAAICHGPWTLIDAEGVRGRRMTSWPSLKTDLRNAGAQWEDSEVVTDQGLVTSRNPGDVPAFCRKMIEEFREGRHERRAVNDQGASRAAG